MVAEDNPDTTKTNPNLIAPKGKYRLMEIDIGYATGLYGHPEEASYKVGDFRFLFHAHYVAKKMCRDARFAYQIHDDKGELVLYRSLTRTTPGKDFRRRAN